MMNSGVSSTKNCQPYTMRFIYDLEVYFLLSIDALSCHINVTLHGTQYVRCKFTAEAKKLQWKLISIPHL